MSSAAETFDDVVDKIRMMCAMGLDQLFLIVVMLAMILLDQANTRALKAVPDEERAVLEVLLKPLWIGTLLFVAAIAAELGRLLLGLEGYPSTHVPIYFGFGATMLTGYIRRRAYRIYEEAANPKMARVLQRRATIQFLLSSLLWGGLAIFRLQS